MSMKDELDAYFAGRPYKAPRKKLATAPVVKDRTEYVHLAAKGEPCRFKLCRLAAKATRATHLPGSRLTDTMNSVLRSIGEGGRDGR
jgi:hypothetical protein